MRTVYFRMAKRGLSRVTRENEHFPPGRVVDGDIIVILDEYVNAMRSSDDDSGSTETALEIPFDLTISSEYIDRVHSLLLHQLKEKHSQIRLSALQICNHLFKKFEYFRKLMVANFSVFLKLTVQTDVQRALPPPKKFATDLEIFAIKCLKEWNDTYGKDFKDEFKFVFKYLNKYKKIDFETMTVQSVTEARLSKEKEQRRRILNEEKLKKIESAMNEFEPEITMAAQTLETCLELLIPTPEEFFIPEMEEDVSPNRAEPSSSSCPAGKRKRRENDSDDENARRRETGTIDRAAVVTVTLKPDFRKRVKKTEDNSAIIENANEQVKLISGKYLPKVKTWLQDIAKISNENLMKRAIELKQRLSDLVSRENKITYYENDDDCSSESDMEEVPATSADDLLVAQCLQTKVAAEDTRDVSGDTTESETVAAAAAADGKKNHSAVEVPKLPFDIDLYHWEDEQLTTPRILPTNQDGNSFWTSNSVMDTDCDGIILPGGSTNLRTRVIEFTGKFEKVDRQCRAPLPSGRLCPREDRYKCPFHGRIVSRDELGRVINPEDEKLLEKEKKPSIPDWQDPSLLRDIQRQTGVDLTLPEKGKRKKQKKNSNLIDLKKEHDNPRTRLEKKVFKKSSVKKVAKILDSMDQRKFRDKFGDQFNYVHDTA